MQKPIFIFLGLIACTCAGAQVRRSGGLNPSANPNRRELLVDKNNYLDQNLNGLPNKSPNLSSLTSAYPIVGISLENHSTDTILLSSVGSIKLIDARFDNDKVGFLPLKNEIQKNGYNVAGLEINKKPAGWLKEDFFEKNIITDSNSKRQLVIVIRNFWFSNTANELYTVSNPRLLTTLHYKFDVYSSIDFGYYPQRKIEGSFTGLHGKGYVYNELVDSLLSLLKKDLRKENFAAKETESNWQSPVDFNDYYNTRIRQASHFEKMPKGLYQTYTDFLEGHVISDSIELTKKYTNYDQSPLYACELTAFRNGLHQPSNQSWGYFNGTSLFLNAGNGFFIRLINSKQDHVFFHLKNIQEDRIKKDMLDGIRIGDSPYMLLKDYTKAFALTYQLDLETGKLY